MCVQGLVEKLEVVDKKWVRVKLLPGNAVDGAVSASSVINSLPGVIYLGTSYYPIPIGYFIALSNGYCIR